MSRKGAVIISSRKVFSISSIIIISCMAVVISFSGTDASIAAGTAGVKERVSTDAGGLQANGPSGYFYWSFNKPAVSADGKYVAFSSIAGNLVPGSNNNTVQIYVKNTLTGAISMASTDGSGNPFNQPYSDPSVNGNLSPSISGDGRYVAFHSVSWLYGTWKIYVKDMLTGSLRLISEGGHSPTITADGRFVAFSDSVTSSSCGSGSCNEIFLWDSLLGTRTMVSTRTDGGQAAGGWGGGGAPSISADGRYVAFSTDATNLVTDTNGVSDVFIKDLHTGAVVRASTDAAGQQTSGGSTGSHVRGTSLSANGRYVLFQSDATNLVPGDTNGIDDIFVKDLQTGSITRVSTDSSGAQAEPGGNYCCTNDFSLSGDGRFAILSLSSPNLVQGDNNGSMDVFVKSIATGEMKRLSTDSAGIQGDGDSGGGAISSDGSVIAFGAMARNLVSGDTNNATDVFTALNPFLDIRNYYFPWYDSTGGRTWVLTSQPSAGSPAAHSNSFDVYLRNMSNGLMDVMTSGLAVDAGQTKNVPPNGRMGGPVKVVANQGEGLVSERSLFGNSFEEVWASAYSDLDSHYWWPVYDSASPGMKNWVLVANPPENGEFVTARVRIHGTAIDEIRNLAPGESWTPLYGGVFGGPVEVNAWKQGGNENVDQRKVIASQRVLFNGAFNELPGITHMNLRDSYMWTWYDNDGGANWITLANPSPTDWIWGQIMVGNQDNPVYEDGDWIAPLQTRSFRGPGMGGPVYAFGFSEHSEVPDADIVATQRVLWGPSFGEIAGTSADAMSFTTSSWTWYDQASPGVKNWVLVANPIDETIYFEIRIAGQTVWGDTVAPGGNKTPTFPGTMGGPVEVEAWLSQVNPQNGQQTKQDPTAVFASQRVVWNGYFNEIVGKGL